MRAFSLQRRHRSRPNVFVQSWRRWMARPADQLLETARLGFDNLEYLTVRAVPEPERLCVGSGAGIGRSSLARSRRLARLL